MAVTALTGQVPLVGEIASAIAVMTAVALEVRAGGSAPPTPTLGLLPSERTSTG